MNQLEQRLLETPSLSQALLFGGAKQDWEQAFDLAAGLRQDDAVLRCLENIQRCSPMPASSMGMGRPHIFRALFQKNIGGVSGTSDMWVDANLYSLDGVSGKVQSLVDYIDNTHGLNQSTAANQAAVPVTSASFNNQLTLTFTDSCYQSNRSTALWTFLQNTSDIFMVFRNTSYPATGVYLETFNFGDGFNGATSTSATMGAALYRSGATLSGAVTASAVPTTPLFYRCSIRPTTLQLKLTGQSQLSASPTGTATTAGKSLCLGARAASVLPWKAEFCALWIFRRGLSTAERTIMESYALAKYGVSP